MKKRFENNLNIYGRGGVVAAPDNETKYWFHWERDGALSMRSYMRQNNMNYDTIKEKMDSYVLWVNTA